MLAGDELLPESRVLALADVVETMASHRPYRPALSIDEALAEVAVGTGTRYDAGAAEVCTQLLREQAFTFAD